MKEKEKEKNTFEFDSNVGERCGLVASKLQHENPHQYSLVDAIHLQTHLLYIF